MVEKQWTICGGGNGGEEKAQNEEKWGGKMNY